MKRFMLVLAMLLALATTAQASVWTATDGVGTTFTKTNNTYLSGDFNVGNSHYKSLAFDFDITASGSWDGVGKTKATKLATLDTFNVEIFRNGSSVGTYVVDTIDNSLQTDSQRLHLQYLIPSTSGVYSFKLWSDVTARDEMWTLEGAMVSGSCKTAPTPVPAAIWLLGSGIVATMGVKRRFSKD